MIETATADTGPDLHEIRELVGEIEIEIEIGVTAAVAETIEVVENEAETREIPGELAGIGHEIVSIL